ncbi:MAG: hypothetical protein KDB87_10075, partial [Flavobacteriales bacterium]|nr:hypothetical protein [Flavobacteriales bacterium]
VRSNKRSEEEPAMPLKLRARISEQVGQARLDWATTRGAVLYVVEHNAVSPDQADAWQSAGETTRTRLVVKGLESAKE